MVLIWEVVLRVLLGLKVDRNILHSIKFAAILVQFTDVAISEDNFTLRTRKIHPALFFCYTIMFTCLDELCFWSDENSHMFNTVQGTLQTAHPHKLWIQWERRLSSTLTCGYRSAKNHQRQGMDFWLVATLPKLHFIVMQSSILQLFDPVPLSSLDAGRGNTNLQLFGWLSQWCK
jgi:hypothetical protein